ncbi:hypothetical protein BASA81_002033 [Batrachochytrium salamandrivorans]|nr:hypothetical protein BASA81_002033 [Batrachochytrium salamandrivorans]
MPVTLRSAIGLGQAVWLVQKQDQGTGRLSHGVVAALLTSSANHPRGIKVRTTNGLVGRVERLDLGGEVVVEESDFAPPPAAAAAREWPITTKSKQRQRTWTCKQCTLINPGNLSQCEVCEARRQ